MIQFKPIKKLTVLRQLEHGQKVVVGTRAQNQQG